jgi:pimeloyl-ACP methyl ester carboxylesterase
MSYEAERDDAELQHLLDGQIKRFLKNYPGNPVGPEQRRTVILFPGGLGSALIRAKVPVQPIEPAQTDFEDFWITLGLLFGGVDNVAMQGDVDSDDRFVVPNAEVKVMGVGPYDAFRTWCHQQNLDLFVFGYDWRRRPEPTIKFFFERFLPALQGEVQSTYGPANDPLGDLTLIGHSLGGMFVKLIMNDSGQAAQVTRAITVGSPFYGYTGQTLRYFEGEKEFFLTGKKKMAEIIATLEGGYYLQFLDGDTYDLYRSALANVPDYPLLAYPSLDPDGSRADPFNPIDTAKGVRYPPWVDRTQLGPAKASVQHIAAELPAAVLQKFFNIRGVQAKNGNVGSDTSNAQTWSLVPPTFDPDNANAPVPLHYQGGPGDGVIPAWSSRLVGLQTNLPNNVTTFTGDLDHMFLMELPDVQQRILDILNETVPAAHATRVQPRPLQLRTRIDIETAEQATSFVQSLKSRRTAGEARAYLDHFRRTHSRAEVEKMARGILALLVPGPARPTRDRAG